MAYFIKTRFKNGNKWYLDRITNDSILHGG